MCSSEIRNGYTHINPRMEENMLYSLLCILFLILAVKSFLQTRKEHKNLPPSPPALPIIGHLHLLKQPIHRTLHKLSQKYGPIFSLKFGSHLAIVVSSPSGAEECFAKNDIVLANRPDFLLNGKYLCYDYTTMGSARYGEHWRNLRRISVLEIFSPSRLNKSLDLRRDEVKSLLGRLYRVSSQGFAKVELRAMLLDLTSNVITRMIAGKRYYGEDANGNDEAREVREVIQEFFACVEAANAGDFIPMLQWVDFNGYEKRVKRAGEKMDLFLKGLIDEHRTNKDRNANTMISHLLALQESEPEYYTDEIIKGLVQVLLLGGIETTASSLEWALSNLLNHPNVLDKAKEELDIHVGQDHLIDEADFSKLHYLKNIITENLRLYPVAPLLVPHMSSTNCNIAGYDVPPNTMVFVNAWAIQRDPTLWDDPTTFKPERYETGNLEAYKLMPFGLGRRACPGESLAKRVMPLALGSLIQCFEWKRMTEKEIDMTEKVVHTMGKDEPLKVMCKARPILNKILS